MVPFHQSRAMALNIKNQEADQLAHELAETTGESLTVAVITALRERLTRLRAKRQRRRLREDVARIRSRYLRLPLRDTRPPDEILGYDESGLPK